MSKASPQSLQIRGTPPSSKRFNKRVLGGLLGGSALAVLLAASFAFRSPDSVGDAPQELYNTTSKALPDRLAELPASYEDVENDSPLGGRILGPPLPGDVGAGMYGAPNPVPTDNPFRYQPPPAYDYAPVQAYSRTGQPASNTVDPRSSKLFFINGKGAGGGQSPANRDVGAAVDPGVAALAALLSDNGLSGLSQPSTENPDDLNSLSDEPRSSQSDIYNPHSLHTPISPYQVMAGTIISASLVTGLNSDLPGQVVAQVTETVFDTATGQHLLIPQGTRLMGRYESDVEAGQSRALVVWTRLIRPDGSSLVIENLPGVDLSGQAGLHDKVDRHTGSLIGAALLSTVLSIGSELASDDEDRLVEAIQDGGQSTVNQAGQKVVTRALSRKPTLRVRPGWRLRVIVNRDLILTPYPTGA
jgi:type IV secretion system protein VirB10